jgi:hypothetical protein
VLLSATVPLVLLVVGSVEWSLGVRPFSVLGNSSGCFSDSASVVSATAGIAPQGKEPATKHNKLTLPTKASRCVFTDTSSHKKLQYSLNPVDYCPILVKNCTALRRSKGVVLNFVIVMSSIS